MRARHILLALLLTLCGCAGQSVTLSRLEPAANGEAARMRTLAVGALRNDDGAVAGAALESALSGVRLGSRPYFRLLAADAELEEQIPGLRRRGVLAGVDGVVLGTVTYSDWRDRRSVRQRYVCVDYRDNGNCRKMASRDVRCVDREGVFAFTPRLVEAATGRVVFAKEISETVGSSFCPGVENESPRSGADLVAEARAHAMERFRDEIAPHFVRFDAPLLVDDDSAMPAGVKKSVDDGAAFAAAGDMGRACSLWRAAEGAHKTGYAIPYLLGLCAESSGDEAEALRRYELASQRTSRPVPAVSDALARVRAAMASAPALRTQMR